MDVAGPLLSAEERQAGSEAAAAAARDGQPRESAAQAAMAVALRSGSGRWGGFGPGADWGRAAQAAVGNTTTSAADGASVGETADSAEQPPTPDGPGSADVATPDLPSAAWPETPAEVSRTSFCVHIAPGVAFMVGLSVIAASSCAFCHRGFAAVRMRPASCSEAL